MRSTMRIAAGMAAAFALTMLSVQPVQAAAPAAPAGDGRATPVAPVRDRSGGPVRTAAAEDGPYWMFNANSGKCLTVQNASVSNGAAAVQYTCDNVAPFNERWEFVDLGTHPADHWYHIRNAHSGLCLTIHGASTANGAFGVQYTCDDRNFPYNEEWQLL